MHIFIIWEWRFVFAKMKNDYTNKIKDLYIEKIMEGVEKYENKLR